MRSIRFTINFRPDQYSKNGEVFRTYMVFAIQLMDCRVINFASTQSYFEIEFVPITVTDENMTASVANMESVLLGISDVYDTYTVNIY